jgi:hypothetical protein
MAKLSATRLQAVRCVDGYSPRALLQSTPGGADNQRIEEIKRRIKNQRILPSADIAAMFWGLLTSGSLRRIDVWKTTKRLDQPIDLAA